MSGDGKVVFSQDGKPQRQTFRNSVNQKSLPVQSLEALAEIFDFAAGLVQRVLKKPSEVKADLQNSTASQGDCSWDGIL